MPRLLSRIEREYVLKHMSETRPALLVRSGDAHFDVAERSYTLDRGSILPVLSDGSGSASIADNQPCEVRFSHRKRALSFMSTFSVNAGSVRIPIAGEFFTSGDHTSSLATCRLRVWFPGLPMEFRDAPAFPLDFEYVDPEDAALSEIALRKVTARLGVNEPDGTVLFSSHRLKEYFDRVKTDADPGQWGRTILYVDETLILVTVESASPLARSHDGNFGVSIDYGARRIECACSISGTIPVTGDIALACLSYAEIKPEDSRFLHEKAHREKFIG